MPDLEINFQWVSNAQSLKTDPREIKTLGENFARMVTEEFAVAASRDNFNRVRSQFLAQMRNILRAEVSRMAMLIGKNHAQQAKTTGPYGQMSMLGGLSTAAQQRNWEPTFKRQQANIQWRKRHPEYMAWKKRKGMPDRWWEATGDLKKYLGSRSGRFYEETFGPIRVRFVRPPPGRDARGRFTRAPNVLKTSAINPETQTPRSRGSFNVTSPGNRGKVSSEHIIGTLEVDFFGKITPAMLPGLNKFNPKAAEPSSGDGVVGLFPDTIHKAKLLEDYKGKHKRWSVEPFVSFFLMRSMPNAVWKRTEQMFKGAVETNSGKGGGLGAQFGSATSRGSY